SNDVPLAGRRARSRTGSRMTIFACVSVLLCYHLATRLTREVYGAKRDNRRFKTHLRNLVSRRQRLGTSCLTRSHTNMAPPTPNSITADSHRIEQLAEQLTRGELSLDNFLRQLAQPKTADLTEVQLDLDRRRRCGYPEAIFGEGKPLATLEKLI